MQLGKLARTASAASGTGAEADACTPGFVREAPRGLFEESGLGSGELGASVAGEHDSLRRTSAAPPAGVNQPRRLITGSEHRLPGPSTLLFRAVFIAAWELGCANTSAGGKRVRRSPDGRREGALFGLRENFLVKKSPEPSTPEFRAADLDNAKFTMKGKLRARTPRYSVNESSLRNADTCTTFRPAKSIKKKLKKKAGRSLSLPGERHTTKTSRNTR